MKAHSIHIHRLVTLTSMSILITGCAIVRPGEVGVKQRLGKLDTSIHEPGTVIVNPFITKIAKVPNMLKIVNKDIGRTFFANTGIVRTCFIIC